MIAKGQASDHNYMVCDGCQMIAKGQASNSL